VPQSRCPALLVIEALLLSVVGCFGGIFSAWFIGQVINVFLTHFANSKGVLGPYTHFCNTMLVLVTILLTIVVGFWWRSIHLEELVALILSKFEK